MDVAILDKPSFQSTSRKEGGTDFFIHSFKMWLWRIILLCSFLQIVFWDSKENVWAVFTVLIAWKVVNDFVLKLNLFRSYPLSTYTIFGYALTQFYLPIIFTLIEGKPVVFNLKYPFQVFTHALADIVVIIIAHSIYRNLVRVKAKNGMFQKFLFKNGMFSAPSDFQLWMIGCVGLCALLFSVVTKQAGGEVEGSSGKFIEGFIIFSYAPFFIYLKRLYTPNLKITPNKHALLMTGYTVILFAISIMRNSRGAFMYGFVGLGYGYLLGLLLNYLPSKLFTTKNVLIAFSGMWLITGPLSDLGTAMLVVRAQRSDISASELLTSTIKTYSDKASLEVYRNATSGPKNTGWDEAYLDNLFLARFSNLKINDASLEMANKIGNNNSIINEYALNLLLANLPQPVIDFLDIHVDKKAIISHSFGDILYDRAGGESALGGFRSGHFDGTGIAAFGWWYLFILGLGLIPCFYLFDILTIKVQSKGLSGETSEKVIFSLCGLLSLISIFLFIKSESVISYFNYVLRGWVQVVVLYYVVYQLSVLLERAFLRRST